MKDGSFVVVGTFNDDATVESTNDAVVNLSATGEAGAMVQRP